MLIAALLCPGPSLAKWPDETFAAYSIRVGVNRGILRYPCTAWAALDGKSIHRIMAGEPVPPSTEPERIPDPIPLYTDSQAITDYRKVWDARFPVVKIPHTGFSCIAGLHVCQLLGATEIDVYGADWTTEPDFDGKTLIGTVRSLDRWKREARAWEKAIELMKLKVNRKQWA
jgi:hypothetical protein